MISIPVWLFIIWIIISACAITFTVLITFLLFCIGASNKQLNKEEYNYFDDDHDERVEL